MNRRRFLRNSAGVLVPLSFGIITRAKAQSNFQLQRQIAAAGVAAASGGSCPADGSPSVSTTGSTPFGYVGYDATFQMTGHAGWNDGGTARTICKVGFQLTASGTINTKTYTAYIYAAGAGNTITVASPLATSNGVTGVNSWAAAMVRFTFPTPYTTAGNAGTGYCFVMRTTANSTTNYVYNDECTTNTIPGVAMIWTSAGADSQQEPVNDAVVEIYWQ